MAVLGSLGLEAKQVRANFLEGLKHENPPYTFAHDLKPDLTTQGLILVTGGACRDPKGYPVAYNASYMFYWLERRGWNICTEEHTPAKIAEFKNKGAVYFIAEKKFINNPDAFISEMENIYPVVASSDSFEVFDLKGGGR